MKKLIALIAFGITFGVVQGPAMYLFLRVLHWHFLLSAMLASLAGVLVGFPVYRYVSKLLGVRQDETN